MDQMGRGRDLGDGEVILPEIAVKLHSGPGELSGRGGRLILLFKYQVSMAAGVTCVPKYSIFPQGQAGK